MDGRGAAGGLPGKGLLPAVHRRPVGVLPGQRPTGHSPRHGDDRFLIAVAQELHEVLRDEAAAAWASSLA